MLDYILRRSSATGHPSDTHPGRVYLFAQQALLGGSGCARRQAPAAGGELPAAIMRTQHVLEQADVSVQNGLILRTMSVLTCGRAA